MESRIAVIETDIHYLKESVARLVDHMKSVNDAIVKLVAGQAELKGDMKTLRAEVRADISVLETKMMRWFVATTLSCAALGFSAAKLFS